MLENTEKRASLDATEQTTRVNALREYNETREQEFANAARVIAAAHAAASPVPYSSYPLVTFRARVTAAVRRVSGVDDVNAHLEMIERGKFGGDIAVRVPELLQRKGAKEYIRADVPQIADALRSADFADAVEKVDARGIYVNVRLRDRYLLESLGPVIALGDRFGWSELERSRALVVDYSSPNVAKQLHAGHIRSTIIGHVLCNLHRACGARVVGVNHINDFGGFGFMLEGYRRWHALFPQELTPNDRLLELYAIRRSLERSVAHTGGLETLPADARTIVDRYLGPVASKDGLAAAYAEFVAASDAAFERLESGDPETVALWRQMVEWSLDAFEQFYDLLDIHIPFTIGESFYLDAGNHVVDEGLATGKAVVFTSELVAQAIADVDAQLARGEITEAHRAELAAQIKKDTGAVVVPLPNGERLVVRRSDGRSIYATRDLGAIAMRRRLFDATDMIYVTGQEQRVHFARLFQAAVVLGIAPAETRFKHVYFGFYIDSRTKRKLSSRESTSGVHQLLQGAIEHFKRKYQDAEGWSPEDVESTARQLAVGSLIFNDLKKDMKSSVEIATDDLGSTIADFEQSGGAYVVYAGCRARSILRRYSGSLPAPGDVDGFELTEAEASLILQIQQVPLRIAEASEQDNPSLLIRHLLEMATAYNSYYMQSPVLKGGEVHMHRLLITTAIRQSLQNALRLCHVESPERI